MRASIYTTEDCILAERNLAECNLADYVLMYFLIYPLVFKSERFVLVWY